jgi:hypothetical protein
MLKLRNLHIQRVAAGHSGRPIQNRSDVGDSPVTLDRSVPRLEHAHHVELPQHATDDDEGRAGGGGDHEDGHGVGEQADLQRQTHGFGADFFDDEDGKPPAKEQAGGNAATMRMISSPSSTPATSRCVKPTTRSVARSRLRSDRAMRALLYTTPKATTMASVR